VSPPCRASPGRHAGSGQEAADVAEGKGWGRAGGASGLDVASAAASGGGGWCGAGGICELVWGVCGEAVRHAMRMAGGKRGEGTQEDGRRKGGGDRVRREDVAVVGGPREEQEWAAEWCTTDLLPLLRAQVGVVMAGGHQSRKGHPALGVHRLPLVALALLHMQQGAAGEAKVNGEGCVDARPVMEVAPWTLLDASCWEELEVFPLWIHFTEIDSALPLPAAVLALVGAALVSCWYSLAADNFFKLQNSRDHLFPRLHYPRNSRRLSLVICA
ncbi:unnamed protein product, partial [Closterium sp. NIES-65]